MKKTILPLITFFLFSAIQIEAKQQESFLFGGQEAKEILVNNRILAKVNGKAISVFDIMKKMDILFYRQFPEYTSSLEARHQFYQVNWRHVINDLIDKELILADAEENKLPVSNGDVRQEMESLFGPNIIGNLDKIGMSYEEAWNIVKGDITLRRMIGYKINSKAVREVTPLNIRLAYQEFVKENSDPETFIYTVISFRNADPEKGKKVAAEISEKLKNKTLSLDELASKIKEDVKDDTLISLSEEFTHTEKEMSLAYKEAILKLQSEEFSEPIAQKSRADKSSLFRVFYLKEKIPGGSKPFSLVETMIKNKLIDRAVEKETVAYLKKLRAHFDVQEGHLAELKDQDYQPFILK